jgi:DNA polymerase-1
MTIHYITTQQGLEEKKVLPTIMAYHSWGFDTETSGLDPYNDRVTLVQIGNEKDQFVIDSRKVNIEPLRPFFESDEHYKFGHNLKFDYRMMKGTFGIEVERCRDTWIAEKLICNGLKFSGFGLADVLENYLEIKMDDKKELQKSFINHVGDYSEEQIKYAARDVEHMLPLKKKMVEKLREEELEKTFFLECEAIPAFGDMEMFGLLLNQDEWLKIANENLAKAKELIPQMNFFAEQAPSEKFKAQYLDMFGEAHINYGSPKQVVELINALGIKLKEKDEETGKIIEMPILASDDKTLKKIKGYPFIDMLKKYRGYMVRYGTFGQPFLDAVHKKTNRIHMDLAQIGTETGRIAAGHSPVNMLNIPRDKRMRNCFYAPEDYVIETDDYSGCELRIWAHISKDPSLCKALNDGIDLHCYVASKLYGKNVTKTENKHLRTPAKTLNFGRPVGCTLCA